MLHRNISGHILTNKLPGIRTEKFENWSCFVLSSKEGKLQVCSLLSVCGSWFSHHRVIEHPRETAPRREGLSWRSLSEFSAHAVSEGVVVFAATDVCGASYPTVPTRKGRISGRPRNSWNLQNLVPTDLILPASHQLKAPKR